MSKITIAVVDDEVENRELLQRVLGREYDVEVFGSALEASEALGSHRFAMLITDIMMPEMDGLELARHARKICPNLIILAVTGFTEMQEVMAAHSEGVLDVMIAKPWQASEIRKSVERGLLVRELQNVVS